ncbi:hypothetical protein [Simkania negevensis]|uniref:Uncharacterized protein n=1 Tax=Simkania negevensis (strain ATCC VR-1471 / DSM 27360 / Z) TaxID=331113 RepID=F8L5G7_SIMNZ|nr:hypothetical protein [Simkania negevensis]CCB89333.1 unknown protein [Simkania negevensis Z]
MTKEKYSESKILKFAEKDSTASEKTNRQENKGNFSFNAVNQTEVAKESEIQEATNQNLTSLLNSNQSVLQGHLD